ncbi:MAG: VOC family protein [Gammaproteobacteria bacterium]|nr:VOC family protein [Gammaproteobacteria bacterium]MCW8986662.1 VOC family protein [Gammaproteobacteria bacterium]
MKNNVILRLHHVSFIVADLDKSLAFYQAVLGLEIDSQRPDLGYPGAWLTLPEQQQIHLMQLNNPDKNSERPEHGGRDHHVAFTVKSIDKIADSLKSLGMTYTKSKSGRKALFCRDPDSNALEFIEDL